MGGGTTTLLIQDCSIFPPMSSITVIKIADDKNHQRHQQLSLPNQTSEGRRRSPEPPELPFFKDEPPAPGLSGNDVISLDEEITECRRPEPPLGGGGTINPDRGILVVKEAA